jgi:hypothetical protein
MFENFINLVIIYIMEKESDNNLIQSILKDFLAKLCSTCIEDICNSALQNVMKLKITDPQKKINYYLAFLQESISNIEYKKSCKAHNGYILNRVSSEEELYCECQNSDDDSSDEKNMLTLEEYKKIQNIFQLSTKIKKKRKKKNK